MLIFDIIIIGTLVWAFFSGLRSGIIVQVAGLAGLFAGAWLAFRFGRQVGLWLGANESMASVAGFIILFLAALIAVAFIGKLLRGMFRLAGLGAIDKLGGALLSLLKIGLIVGLLLYSFDSLNRRTEWFTPQELEESRMYGPMVSVAEHSFPFIDIVKGAVMPGRDDVPAREPNELHEGGEAPGGEDRDLMEQLRDMVIEQGGGQRIDPNPDPDPDPDADSLLIHEI